MTDDESLYPDFLWRRWDSDETEGRYEAETLSNRRLFEFCAVPFAGDPIREPRPTNGDESDIVYFLPPRMRLLLRNVPSLVLVFLVLVVVEAELTSNTQGISTFVPAVPVMPLIYLFLAIAGITVVIVHSGMISRETVVRAAFIYALAGVLLVGTIYGTYRTLVTRGGAESTPHVVYTFPTLLFTLLIGLLAYDLLLKGENLYGKLGQKNIISEYRTGDSEEKQIEAGESIVDGETRYKDIRDNVLKPKLEAGIGPFRSGHLFALLVLSQYLLIWSFKGPLGTGLWSSLLLNLIINLVVLVGVFNFLIGIMFLRELLKGEYTTSEGAPLKPRYLPFHPDQQGGYADIGKLAMRINIIMILIGAYYVYRAYISGLRTFPEWSSLAFEPLYAGLLGITQSPALEIIFWTINFLGPILLYVMVVAVWFYYTFWEIHKQMSKQKKDLILKEQSKRIEAGDTGIEGLERRPLGDYEDMEDWQALYDAPEWPINTRELGGLITANFAPLLLSLLTVLPDLFTAWQ